MAYSIELEERTIYLAMKAESSLGDYIVYEWNDGIYIPEDEDEYEMLYDDECVDDMEYPEDACLEEDEVDEVAVEDDYFEDEDEIERAVREDMEAILAAGFVPQGGVSAIITPEYTTCYSQAFFRKK